MARIAILGGGLAGWALAIAAARAGLSAWRMRLLRLRPLRNPQFERITRFTREGHHEIP